MQPPDGAGAAATAGAASGFTGRTADDGGAGATSFSTSAGGEAATRDRLVYHVASNSTAAISTMMVESRTDQTENSGGADVGVESSAPAGVTAELPSTFFSASLTILISARPRSL